MVTANDFFSLEDWTMNEQQCSCLLTFNAEHEIFQGHFPGNPIVPGVCTLGIVKDALVRAIGKPLCLFKAPMVKYLGLITPDKQVRLSASWVTTDEGFVVNANVADDATVYFKMNAAYR